MKEKILIYSIFRNSSSNIDNYYQQLVQTINKLKESYEFYISLYENDSTDNTKEKLAALDFSFVKNFSLISEQIGSNFYGKSIKDEDRVKNLAAARNKAIHANDFLNQVDKVLCIESDIYYETTCIKNLLNFQKDNNLPSVDIVSAVSYQGKDKLYDTWATRRNNTEESGDLFENKENKKFDIYWSTFNCICLYNAEVMRQGAIYDWYNSRLKKFDCDTAVICEKFRDLGHDNIFIDYRSVCSHIKKRKGI